MNRALRYLGSVCLLSAVSLARELELEMSRETAGTVQDPTVNRSSND